MHGLGGLYKNELLKTIRQTGFKVILIIFAVLMVVIPTFLICVNKFTDHMFMESDYYETRISDENATDSEKAFYKALRDSETFFKNANATDDSDWRYSRYKYDYDQVLQNIAAYDLLIAGNDIAEIEMYFYSVPTVSISEDGTYYFDYDYESADYSAYGDYETYDYQEHTIFDISADDAEAQRNLSLLFKKQIEDKVLENDFQSYLAERIDDLTAERGEYEKKISEYDELISKNSSDVMTAVQKRDAVQQVKRIDVTLSGYKLLHDKKFASDSWGFMTVDGYLTISAAEYIDYPPYTEEEFNALRSQYSNEYDNYSSYAAASDAKQKSTDNKVARIMYSLENNIPIPEVLESSTKSMWQSNIFIISSLIIVFMIISAGISVSSEYSSGTIRLLLVRPRKRWKILLSKLLSVLTYSVILMAMSYIVIFLVAIIFNGAGDIFTPDIFAKNGTAFEVNSFVSALYILFQCVASGFMYMSFAFMLSTAAGKSALAIALPFLAQSFSSTVFYISCGLNTYWSFIKYTPLPYFNLSLFASTNDGLLSIPGLAEQFSFGIGLVYTAALTLLFLVISFATFSKKQIKS